MLNPNTLVTATPAQLARLSKIGYPDFKGSKKEASRLISKDEYDKAMREPSAKSLTLLQETCKLYGLAPMPLPHAKQREISSQIAVLIALGKLDKGFITADEFVEQIRERFCFRRPAH